MPPVRPAAQILILLSAGSALGFALNVASPRSVSLTTPVYPSSASGTAACAMPPQPAGSTAGGTVASTFVWRQYPTVRLKDAVAACTACTAGFVDARGAAAYAQGHIPKAVHLPPVGHVDARSTLQELRKHETVIVYGEGSGCNLANGVADRLTSEGFKDVRILEGSWREWQDEGGPAESGVCKACDHGGTMEAHR